MSKQLIAIWAEAHNHVIGKNHTMPWHLPAELAHFKKTTMGSAILMGRVTFDGMNRRCLPGRETLILTRDKDFDCEGVTTVTSGSATSPMRGDCPINDNEYLRDNGSNLAAYQIGRAHV